MQDNKPAEGVRATPPKVLDKPSKIQIPNRPEWPPPKDENSSPSNKPPRVFDKPVVTITEWPPRKDGISSVDDPPPVPILKPVPPRKPREQNLASNTGEPGGKQAARMSDGKDQSPVVSELMQRFAAMGQRRSVSLSEIVLIREYKNVNKNNEQTCSLQLSESVSL